CHSSAAGKIRREGPMGKTRSKQTAAGQVEGSNPSRRRSNEGGRRWDSEEPGSYQGQLPDRPQPRPTRCGLGYGPSRGEPHRRQGRLPRAESGGTQGFPRGVCRWFVAPRAWGGTGRNQTGPEAGPLAVAQTKEATLIGEAPTHVRRRSSKYEPARAKMQSRDHAATAGGS